MLPTAVLPPTLEGGYGVGPMEENNELFEEFIGVARLTLDAVLPGTARGTLQSPQLQSAANAEPLDALAKMS